MVDDRSPDRVLARWRRKARAVLPAADADLVEEIAQFVADRWMQARATGADQPTADGQAHADLDAWRTRPEAHRAVRRHAWSFWSGWAGDLRTAGRALRLHPTFAVGAILLSTVAVAAALSAFALVYGILWRPLPYPAAERLAVIWQNGDVSQLSYADFRDLVAAPVFDGAAAMGAGRGSLRVGDRIERVNALSIEASGLAILGATPQLGRLLRAADAGQPVAMISHRLWSTQLQSDPAIVGRQLWLSGRTYQVVGVLRPGFDFELPIPPFFRIEDNDLWTVMDVSEPSAARRDFTSYEGLVRLAAGRTLDEAQSAIDTVAAGLRGRYPSTNAGRTFRVVPLIDEVTAPVRRPLTLVAVAAVVTLIVALANVVVLGLVRGQERLSELTIREALGAGSYRLRRQLFTEHALIAVCGAGLGALAAVRLTGFLAASEAAHLPRTGAIRFDTPVLWVGALVTLSIAIALTAQPLRLRRSALRSGERVAGTAARTRRALVATEVALALSLTTGGVLLAVSLARLMAVDPGFDANAAAAARLSLYPATYPDRADVLRMHDRLLDALRATPDVGAAGASSSLPLSGQTSGTGVLAEGHAVQTTARVHAGWEYVTPGYFDAAGLRLRAGRDFTAADRARNAHVTVINEALAAALFPGQDPVGRRIGVGGGEAQGDWHEIVGVVGDVSHTGLETAPMPRVYDLLGQHWGRTTFIVVRSRSQNAPALIGTIRRTVADLDRDAPVFDAATLSALVDRSASTRRLAATSATGLAAAGVLLALIGVYAVAAATVAERTRELGVRAALGAGPRELLATICRELAPTGLAGAAAGVAASAAVVRLLDAQLFGVATWEALSIVPLVTAAVLAAMALAAAPPARRAARIDPVDAIRLP